MTAAIFTRVSTAALAEYGISLDAQRERCEVQASVSPERLSDDWTANPSER